MRARFGLRLGPSLGLFAYARSCRHSVGREARGEASHQLLEFPRLAETVAMAKANRQRLVFHRLEEKQAKVAVNRQQQGVYLHYTGHSRL